MHWVLEGKLARSRRPGRELGRRTPVPRELVSEWLETMKRHGIRSIICLLAEDEQLTLYDDVPGGLLSYYCENGFETQHIPTPDFREPLLSESALTAIWEAYEKLPKPVLLHCSGGDRAERAGRFIMERSGQAAPAGAGASDLGGRPRYASRGNSFGFAERTRKNLDYIEKAFKSNEDVHVVTQLVNSLLGLVVFPWEANFVKRIQSTSLHELSEKGWPQWNITAGTCETLGQLIRLLRNGVAHKHIEFSSESRLADRVVLTIWNCRKKNEAPNWVASIRADHLRSFCQKFVELLRDTID